MKLSLSSLLGAGAQPMRPSSSARAFGRPALLDLLWAAASPLLAFMIRDGSLSQYDAMLLYAACAALASFAAFQWFRISAPLPGFMSVHEAAAIVKASGAAVALTVLVVFAISRLDESPRSIPFIHFFVLAGGLMTTRTLARLSERPRAQVQSRPAYDAIENMLVVGANRPAWFFIKMVEELTAGERRIVGILDERPDFHDRTLNGYSIVGAPDQLARVMGEYASHGLTISKVVVALHPAELSADARSNLQTTCRNSGVALEWLHDQFSFIPTTQGRGGSTSNHDDDLLAGLSARSYWGVKRAADILMSAAAMILIAPIAAVVAIMVLFDIGYPAVFWQQRLGHRGRPLAVYKFRTMRNVYDREGRMLREDERISALGWLLRRNRLDEIPQLFNVLAGDMSVVGPRPLLPVDQPKNMALRLQVRPGLTGLAQINGGKLLSPDEKDALDEWYIRHASLWLDIKIIVLTIWVIVRGDCRNEPLIAAAMANRRAGAWSH